MSPEFTYEFLVEKLGDKVTINPYSDCPCLDEDFNFVLEAIETMGGVEVVADRFGLSIEEVARWIDDHYVPDLWAHDVAWSCGFTEGAVQRPQVGYEDPVSGHCWPWTWMIAVRGEHPSERRATS